MNGSHRKLFVALVMAIGLALGACGGDDAEQRTTPEWQPSERLPRVSQRWWWEPVERTCEEDSDCPEGERCQLMRLSSCENCPAGEVAEICVPREGAQAQR